MEQAQSIEHFKILFAGTFGMALLVVFIIVFVINYQKRLIKEHEVRSKLIVKNQEKILKAIIDTQEEERMRISRDLHDELGNALSVAKINLGLMVKSNKNNESNELAIETLSIVDEVLKNARRLSRDLHPALLEKYGLIDAIEALAKKCTSKELEVWIKKPILQKRLNKRIELNIFRITQELISNSLKHSGANLIKIALEFKEEEFLLNYQDNGAGFNYMELQSSNGEGGIGFVTIDARVKILKASWEIQSETGKGTTAFFTFPIKPDYNL